VTKPYSTPRERKATGHTYEYDLASWEASGRVGLPPTPDMILKSGFPEVNMSDEMIAQLRAKVEALELALAAHHRHDFPNLDREYICRECGYDGIDVPSRQAYALAIENDCDADD
jgi:hypothetical protein